LGNIECKLEGLDHGPPKSPLGSPLCETLKFSSAHTYHRPRESVGGQKVIWSTGNWD